MARELLRKLKQKACPRIRLHHKLRVRKRLRQSDRVSHGENNVRYAVGDQDWLLEPGQIRVPTVGGVWRKRLGAVSDIPSDQGPYVSAGGVVLAAFVVGVPDIVDDLCDPSHDAVAAVEVTDGAAATVPPQPEIPASKLAVIADRTMFIMRPTTL